MSSKRCVVKRRRPGFVPVIDDFQMTVNNGSNIFGLALLFPRLQLASQIRPCVGTLHSPLVTAICFSAWR